MATNFTGTYTEMVNMLAGYGYSPTGFTMYNNGYVDEDAGIIDWYSPVTISAAGSASAAVSASAAGASPTQATSVPEEEEERKEGEGLLGGASAAIVSPEPVAPTQFETIGAPAPAPTGPAAPVSWEDPEGYARWVQEQGSREAIASGLITPGPGAEEFSYERFASYDPFLALGLAPETTQGLWEYMQANPDDPFSQRLTQMWGSAADPETVLHNQLTGRGDIRGGFGGTYLTQGQYVGDHAANLHDEANPLLGFLGRAADAGAIRGMSDQTAANAMEFLQAGSAFDQEDTNKSVFETYLPAVMSVAIGGIASAGAAAAGSGAAAAAGATAAEAAAAGTQAAQMAQAAMSAMQGLQSGDMKGLLMSMAGSGVGLSGGYGSLVDSALGAGTWASLPSYLQAALGATLADTAKRLLSGQDVDLMGALTAGAQGAAGSAVGGMFGDAMPKGWDEGAAFGGTSDVMPVAQQLQLMGVAPDAAQAFTAGGGLDATGLLSGLGLTSADVEAYGGAVSGGDITGSTQQTQEQETPDWTKNLAVTATQKIVGMLGEMLGGGAQDQPQRAEGQTDAEYTQALVQYAGIPPTDLAPDSQEYFDYIRAETDRMIMEVLGQDAEFLLEQSPEELANMLGDKRQEELQQLQRALFVRGQMGAMSSRSSAVNPFTGETEELGYDGQLSPTRAAYQRGLAGETEQLAGLRGQDARTFLESLTGRKADLFNMQARQDAAGLRARLEAQDPDSWRRKRRGGEAAADAVQATDADALDRMLAQIGDEDAQMAALRELFGQA